MDTITQNILVALIFGSAFFLMFFLISLIFYGVSKRRLSRLSDEQEEKFNSVRITAPVITALIIAMITTLVNFFAAAISRSASTDNIISLVIQFMSILISGSFFGWLAYSTGLFFARRIFNK